MSPRSSGAWISERMSLYSLSGACPLPRDAPLRGVRSVTDGSSLVRAGGRDTRGEQATDEDQHLSRSPRDLR